MKKKPIIFLSLIIATSLIVFMIVHFSAKEGFHGDYKFIVENGEITISKHKGNQSKIKIPRSIRGKRVTKIGEFAFNGRTSLEEVIIPDSVKMLDTAAFSTCTNLKKVIIPDSVVSIGRNAFQFCEKLETVRLPKDILYVPMSLFSKCSNLKSVIIPKKVQVMGSYVFSECKNLESIYFESDVPCVLDKDTFSEINDYTIFIPDSSIVWYTSRWGELVEHFEIYSKGVI